MTKLLVFNKSQRVRYFSVSVLFHTSLICWRLKRFGRLRLLLINGGGTLERSTRSMRWDTTSGGEALFYLFSSFELAGLNYY